MSKNLSLHLSNENALRYISTSEGKALIGSTPKNHISNSFKSPLKPSFVLNKSPYGSPTNIYHKGGYTVNNVKSPSEKNHPVLVSMEQPEGQENYFYENKGLTTTATKRDSRTTGSSTPQTAVKKDKSSSISQKAGSALSKASKSNKVSFYKYEPTIKKAGERSYEPTVSSQMHMNSTITGKETAKQLNLITKKELSLSKKASLPTNLKLTLDKIYTKDGSSSHRIHLNSPKSESSNNIGGSGSVLRKNGRSVALDNKSKNEQAIVKEPNAKNKLNTLLVGLSRPSPHEDEEINSTKVPKLNVRDINSMNVTPRKYKVEEEEEEEEEEEIFEEDDESTSSKRYRKLLVLLKEKNNEIRRLSKDKSELKNTLDVVGEELTNLNKIKSWFKEKGRSAANLQLDLNDVVLETEEQNNQLTKKGRLSQDFSRNLMQSRYTSQRSMCNLSIGDAKEARTPSSVLNTSHSNMDGASDRLRMALAGDFGKKSTKSKKHAGPVQTSTDFLQIPLQRSYLSMSPYESNRLILGNNTSQLAEYGLKERNNSLVHNETAVKNSIKAKLEGKEAHPHYSKERAKSMQQPNTPKNGLGTAVNSRKQSAYGITQKTQLENSKKSCNNTSNNNDITVDVGILKRKQSHDVNYNLEKTQNLLKRKHSEVKNMSVAEGRKPQEKLDIGKALGDLKNRIANLLNKRSEDGDRKLQLVCQTIQRTLLNGDFQ